MQLPNTFYDIAHFLKIRQKTMYFRQFINGVTDFPLGRGHCIISSGCKNAFCYTFIKDQQLEASPAAQVMNGDTLYCQNCNAQLNKNTLICDISLRALYQRNFTISQLNNFSLVTITPNFILEARQDEKWQQIKKNANNKRLQKLIEYEQMLKKDKKFLINVDTRAIYRQLCITNNSLKSNLNQFKLTQSTIRGSSKSIPIAEFIIYEPHLQPKLIHIQGNTAEAYQMLDIKYENRNKADCTLLGFDKSTKNIFYFDGDSRRKCFHHSNIIKHANRDRKSIKIFKIGTYQTEGQQNMITSAAVHIVDNVIYIVGGRANAKPIKQIYCFDVKKYILEKDQNASVKFNLYAAMRQPRLYSGSDIIYIENQPNLIVYGGSVQQGSRWDTLNDIELIQLHPIKPTNRNVVKSIKSNLLSLSLSTIAAFEQDKFIIFGGHQSVMSDFRAKENKSFIVAKIDYNRLRCDQIYRTPITNYKPLRFGEFGAACSTEKEIVFLRKQQEYQEYSKLTVTCFNNAYSGLYESIRP